MFRTYCFAALGHAESGTIRSRRPRLFLHDFHRRGAFGVIVRGTVTGLLSGTIQFLLRLVLLGYVSLKDFFKIVPEAGCSSGVIFASPKSR
jgi:hypothetical protein